MKKIVSLLIACVLALGCLPAFGEDAYLTAEEIQDYCDSLLQTALTLPPVSPEETEDGGWCFDFGSFALYSEDQALTADSAVILAELLPGEDNLRDMRGIGPGSTAREVLAAYPLDNEDLAGTYEEAVLYINGIAPDTVRVGSIVRNGSHILLIDHTVYTPSDAQMQAASALYTLENNQVVAVQLIPSMETDSPEDMQEEIFRMSELQEQREYSVYRAETPTPLAREDLTFGPIDFLSAVDADLIAVLGAPDSDIWEEEENGYLHTLQWEGVQAILRCDAQKQNAALQYLQIYSERLEGPRCIHMEDSMETVLALFPQEGEGDVLYGDGDNAPTGVVSYGPEAVSVLYAAEAEDDQVALKLDFVDDALWVITCMYL